MKLVKVTGKDSVVSITGLDASEHYLILVESCSASGVTSVQNSTISVTTRGVVGVNVVIMVLVILVVFLVLFIIVAGICSAWRYLHFFAAAMLL